MDHPIIQEGLRRFRQTGQDYVQDVFQWGTQVMRQTFKDILRAPFEEDF